MGSVLSANGLDVGVRPPRVTERKRAPRPIAISSLVAVCGWVGAWPTTRKTGPPTLAERGGAADPEAPRSDADRFNFLCGVAFGAASTALCYKLLASEGSGKAGVSASPESTISLMTRLAIQHGAVNLSQGFPNEPPPLRWY